MDQVPVPPDTLSAEDLTPTELQERGIIQMSSEQLYQACLSRRFYFILAQSKNEPFYPAWQFTEPAPDLLPQILALLHQRNETRLQAWLIIAEDRLNELAPAEVLAGKQFRGRSLGSAQERILSLCNAERLELVKNVLLQPPVENAIG